jgi:hypothetical protein
MRRIIDLDALCVKLTEFSKELETTNGFPKITQACRSLLKLLNEPSDFYYQFIHGGCATGFEYQSKMILINTTKIIATIKANVTETIPQLKKQLLSNINDTIREVQANNNFEYPQLHYDYKPPSWEKATNYFISYAHADSKSQLIVKRLKFVLGHTINLWLDSSDLKRHQQLPKALNDAMMSSEACILLFSKNYLKSKWCNEEWQALFMKRFSAPNYRLYVIRMDNAVCPILLSTFYYTDCRFYPRGLAKLEIGKLMREIENYERDLQFYKRAQECEKTT